MSVLGQTPMSMFAVASSALCQEQTYTAKDTIGAYDHVVTAQQTIPLTFG